jgi:hypothetical protein
MLKNIDNQATDGEEKSKPEVIKLGLDLHARQVTECRQLDGSTPKPAQQWDPNIEIHNVSTIAVRRDTHTGPGIAYITYPVDFSRQKDPQSGQINIVPTMLLAENTSKNCYECHKTGVVPIHR